MKQTKQRTFRRSVVATLSKGGISVSIHPPGKIDDVGTGDLIVWSCRNETGQPLTLKIGNFKAAKAFRHIKERRNTHPDPFVRGVPRYVKLGGGSKPTQGVIRCEVKPRAYRRRTYKYDILDGRGTVLLDPEIEIERP